MNNTIQTDKKEVKKIEEEIKEWLDQCLARNWGDEMNYESHDSYSDFKYITTTPILDFQTCQLIYKTSLLKTFTSKKSQEGEQEIDDIKQELNTTKSTLKEMTKVSLLTEKVAYHHKEFDREIILMLSYKSEICTVRFIQVKLLKDGITNEQIYLNVLNFLSEVTNETNSMTYSLAKVSPKAKEQGLLYSSNYEDFEKENMAMDPIFNKPGLDEDSFLLKSEYSTCLKVCDDEKALKKYMNLECLPEFVGICLKDQLELFDRNFRAIEVLMEEESEDFFSPGTLAFLTL
ncbi:unnamed protein product [Moneuplotes crassus]|uniref:Uncharacterized protein n=1 Tax=Euplotes crassus TaxID=5936 RepID=A0AAD1U645_EUPCR|nr:unnamed protein product [Moneuplotes crassus]